MCLFLASSLTYEKHNFFLITNSNVERLPSTIHLKVNMMTEHVCIECIRLIATFSVSSAAFPF